MTYDSLGYRWYLPASSNSPLFTISSSPANALGSMTLTSNGDGSYKFTTLAAATGAAQMYVVGAADQTQQAISSPLPVTVMAARVLSSLVAYGLVSTRDMIKLAPSTFVGLTSTTATFQSVLARMSH